MEKDKDTGVEGSRAISNVGKLSYPTNGSYQAARSTDFLHCRSSSHGQNKWPPSLGSAGYIKSLWKRCQ
jgi:hypothetical protein